MEHEEGKSVMQIVGCLLDRLVGRNDQSATGNSRVTKFHAQRPPTISIHDYLERILKYSGCSNECFVFSLVYIDRIIRLSHVTVSSLNVHRLLITSIMLAAKFFDDSYYNNNHFARVGGVSCTELNSLEVEFLFLLNFNLFVEPKEYSHYYNQLVLHARNEMCSRCSTLLSLNMTTPDSLVLREYQALCERYNSQLFTGK